MILAQNHDIRFPSPEQASHFHLLNKLVAGAEFRAAKSLC